MSCISFPAYASNHTFSVYGSIHDEDGTPIPGTTIRLLEPVNNSFNSEDPGIQSTVTDSKGNFQFINVTTEADTCGITITYPDHMQYFPPGNSFRSFPASDIQIVNVTRSKVERCYALSAVIAVAIANTRPWSPSDAIFAILLAGLVCLMQKRCR